MGHWLVDTAGIGALIVVFTAGPVLLGYVAMVRWIARAPREDGHELPD